MQLGIFAKTYNRRTVEQTLQAVRNDGLSAVQFNMSVLGLPTIPDPIGPQAIAEIAQAADAARVTLAAISGTFNTAHPDPDVRVAYLDRFPNLAQAAAALEIPVITLSSGSRNRKDMCGAATPTTAPSRLGTIPGPA
jgi:sugar phosphate isomerase/epimerase